MKTPPARLVAVHYFAVQQPARWSDSAKSIIRDCAQRSFGSRRLMCSPVCPGLSVENVRRLNTWLADSPRISIELGRFFVPLYLEIPAWSPVPGLFCSALSIARRLTRNRASPNRRVHNRIAAGLAATVKLALCGFCTTDTNNIPAENRWSLANRVCLHESVFIRESR